ncbi:tyrosine-type recombinase/integrase [Vibrio artabrorum]|uniref:site-specific integrase n=1 Tax=Vibrio artabrorum TaxID=446374 RepID=UPI0021C446C5|nr:site-specific integrase [Vibrio artabrorum]
MLGSLEEWIFKIDTALPDTEPSELRDALIIVIHRAYKLESRLFYKNVDLPKHILKKLAKLLTAQAETAHELRATSHVLITLYEAHQQLNPNLFSPTVSLPLRDEKPLFNDTTPPIRVIEALKDCLFNHHPTSKVSAVPLVNIESASLGHAILTVAYRCELKTMQELEALIMLPNEAWQTIIGTYPIVSTLLPNSNRRIYAVEEAILALRRVQLTMNALPCSRQKIRLKESLIDWKTFAKFQYPQHIATLIEALPIDAMVQNLSILDRSEGISHLWQNHHPLKPHTFVRTFAGTVVENPEPSRPSPKVLPTSSIIWNNTLTSEDKSRSKNTHRQLREALEQFKTQSPTQDRRSAAAKYCKSSLIRIQNERHHWTIALPVHWITSLFLYGSPWKATLAVDSLLTYQSAISVFIKVAGFEDGVLDLPLHELEARCQYGLDALKNNDRQRTVIRFLTYCRQFDDFPRIEVDALELSHHEQLTRVHYIPPAMFDALCRRYYPPHAHSPLPIVVFMQLCYYAGLREDEALSLQIMDIDFNTGLLYVTDAKKRKSKNAHRKIPLALIPNHALKSISTLINERRIILRSTQDEDNTLFDSSLYANQEKIFIEYLRDELKDPDLVTHSLRHCTANNWTYLLSVIAFKPPIEPKLHFNQHVLFSSEQREKIKQSFKICGQRLTPYFSILSWVSSQLGHASPSITIGSYLHLLDWVSIVINAKPRPVTKAALRYWTSDSNYGFERQKQLFQSENDRSLTGIVHLDSLRHWVKHHWGVSTYYDISTTFVDNAPRISSNLPFSVYTTELVKLHHHADDKDCNSTLIAWLQSTQCAPNVFIPKANEASAWLTLSLHLDTWHTKPLKNLNRMRNRCEKFLRLLSQKRDITQYRELHNALTIYQSLNLQPIAIKLVGDAHSTSIDQWQKLIQKFGSPIFEIEISGQLTAALRPYRLRWPLWIHIELIIKQIIDYFDFLIFVKDKGY